MIHNPSFGDDSDTQRSKSDTELLDKIKVLIIDGYSERTGIAPEELSSMLDAETWLTAQEALEKGFIDEITDEVLQSTGTANLKNKKPKAVYMSYKKETPKPQALTTILGLQVNADNDTVLKAISSLKNKCVSLETENRRIKNQILEGQKKEAKQLTALAIASGVINKNLEAIQLLAFEKDFKKTKNDLQIAINEVQGSQVQANNHRVIREIVLGQRGTAIGKDKNATIEDKPKNEWTLQDYRKHDPKTLENDKDLYNKLIKAEYKN